MISLRLLVHAHTSEALHARATQLHCEPEQAAAQILQAAVAQWPMGGRAIVLTEKTLATLEAILGGGSVLNEDDLLKKAQRMAGISFGHIRLDLTPGQLERMQERASREGKSVKDVIAGVAPRILETVFGLT